MADLKNDIDKYLRGELSPAEMHALEKRALSDPFLADALEGAAELSPQAFAEDLSFLEGSIDNYIHRKDTKVISMWAWPARIAAGLAVIAVSTWLLFMLTQRDKQELAMTEEQQLPIKEKQEGPIISPAPEASTGIEDQSEEVLDAPKIEAQRAKAPEVKPLQAISNGDVAGRETPAAAPPAPEILQEADETKAIGALENRAPGVAIESAPKTTSQPVTEEKQLNTRPAATEGYSRERAKRSAPSEFEISATDDAKRKSETALSRDSISVVTRVIKGQVTDNSGAGIPGVNVMIKGSELGAVSDENGNYQLKLPALSKELLFSYIGYTSQEVSIQNAENIDVRMEEDASQLSEVVVVGYGVEKTDEFENISTIEFAAPAGGRKAFKQYMEKNLRYPVQAIENKVEGKVTVQFNVESSGQLSGFRVVKGIGNGCDEEVIRLIKEGPKWTATKKDTKEIRDRVKVRMMFSLPKTKNKK